MSASRISGIALLAVALFLFFLGVSSYFWPTTTGTIIDVKHIRSIMDQTPTGVPASKHSQPRSTFVRRTIATYVYSLDNRKYRNNTIAILNQYKLAALGEPKLKKGDAVQVSYLPFYKSYSILEPGIPLPIFSFFSLLGITFLQYRTIIQWFIAALIRKHNLRLMIYRTNR